MENTAGYTKFGEMLRILMVKNNNLKNKGLAEKTKCSQANITNILHGKTCPDLHFLTACQKLFNLDQKDILEFFVKAFSSSKTISIDTSHFSKKRLDWIAKIIVMLLFLPENISTHPGSATDLVTGIYGNMYNIANQYISLLEEPKIPLNQLVLPEKKERKKRTAKKA
jgi:hypothetical protein